MKTDIHKIVKIPFADLWNSEYSLIFSRLIGIIEHYNVEELHLEKPFAKLKSIQVDIDKIMVQRKTSNHSDTLNSLDTKRKEAIRSIIAISESWVVSSDEKVKENAKKVVEFLKKHEAKTISNSNYTSQTERINDVLSDIKQNTELNNAFTALNISPLVEQLRKVNADFEEVFMQRTKENAQIEKIDSKKIRLEADKIIRRFFQYLELYQEEYEEVNYLPLITEINELMSYYKAQLAARATRRKSKKENESERITEDFSKKSI
ncbi:MAG: DUF6261 family protein [Capnocytophaga sp.]|nr:DUF6261 family protein [Capnocytophaga sp.]